jgi:hypothetical protein
MTPAEAVIGLAEALLDVTRRVPAPENVDRPFAKAVLRLSHALVHVSFTSEISLTDTVYRVEISDGYFLPHTKPGIGRVSVGLQLRDVEFHAPDGDSWNDLISWFIVPWFHPSVEVRHLYGGSEPQTAEPLYPAGWGNSDSRHPSIRMDNIGVFLLELEEGESGVLPECDRLEAIYIRIGGNWGDEGHGSHVEPVVFNLTLDCPALREQFYRGEFGEASITDIPLVPIVSSGSAGPVGPVIRLATTRCAPGRRSAGTSRMPSSTWV